MNAERSAQLVRRWVTLYTRGLPRQVREDRRDEIEGDLWSQAHDEGADLSEGLGGEILARFLLGIPADLTWRLEQRRAGRPSRAIERRPQMNTRPISVPAIFGGICWVIWPIVTEARGDAAWYDSSTAWLMMLTVVVGTWALALALIGLIVAFPDTITAPIAGAGVVAAVAAAISVLGAYGLIMLLPIGSALVAWSLRRANALGAWLAWTHAMSAALVLVALGIAVAAGSKVAAGSIASIALLIAALPYGFSWITIGWSLVRGAPAAAESPTGA